MGKSYANGYLIRTPDGQDYDEQPTRKAAERVADRLGPGATVHPLKPGSTIEIMTTPGGKEVTSYTAR